MTAGGDSVCVRPADLRLWRDTLRGERSAVAVGEKPFLHDPWPGTQVSLADRMIASMEAYMISTGTDWPDEQDRA
ncbi:hypothetical protein EV383_4409 [Pseudonocardia sediminis]|uniref:Uncharacterized protein n=1 Tax=Pseudonocardia sediminis TaxID=1397368 RepID=A0A4Q7V1Y2_PSEST|nr:hypothetical protein EV383_4409 [Pseudonocardia sediminis]